MNDEDAGDAAGGREAPASATSAIDRALDLLGIVVEARRPVTLAEASAAADLSKPTAHRILRLLAKRGLLRQQADRSYILGAAIYEVAGQVLDQLEFAREARAALNWLQSVTPEAIHFAVLTEEVPICVAKIEGRRPYRMASTLGSPLSMHCTSIGKAILAYLPEQRVADLIDSRELTRHTSRTITKAAVLRAELDDVRAQGYAIDDEENEDTIRCVAAPVFDARGEIVGGVSVAAPTFHLSLDEAHLLAPSVIQAGKMISSALGAPQQFPLLSTRDA